MQEFMTFMTKITWIADLIEFFINSLSNKTTTLEVSFYWRLSFQFGAALHRCPVTCTIKYFNIAAARAINLHRSNLETDDIWLRQRAAPLTVFIQFILDFNGRGLDNIISLQLSHFEEKSVSNKSSTETLRDENFNRLQLSCS